MKEIKQIINSVVNSYGEAAARTIAARKRFYYPLDPADATGLLISEYKNAVEARGRQYVADNETATRLHSIANWLTNPNCKPSLLLNGSLPGTGKTTTARAIERMAKGLKKAFNAQEIETARSKAAGKWIKMEDSERNTLTMCEASIIVPVFYSAMDLANMVESGKAAFEAAKRSNFLIIDDLGTEPVSVKVFGNEVFPIIEILQHRYAEMLPTIITTNLGLNSISDIYGPRISDRLREMCETLYFAQSESYRR